MKYTLTGLMLMFCVVSQAQKSWHYGIKADLNLSNIHGKGMGTEFVSGYQGGGFVAYDLTKQWGLQADVLVSQNNTKRSGDFQTYYNVNGNYYASENVKLTYLNIPVLARYRVSEAWSFVAGPQVGFLLTDNENLLKYNQRAFKTYEVSGVLGAEFNISNVALYARYNAGISDINDADKRYSWRSQHIQAGIAVRLK